MATIPLIQLVVTVAVGVAFPTLIALVGIMVNNGRFNTKDAKMAACCTLRAHWGCTRAPGQNGRKTRDEFSTPLAAHPRIVALSRPVIDQLGWRFEPAGDIEAEGHSQAVAQVG